MARLVPARLEDAYDEDEEELEEEQEEQVERNYTIDLTKVKVKTLREFEAAHRRGFTMDDMVNLLPRLIDGITSEELDEMNIIELEETMRAVETQMKGAIPKAKGTPSLSPSKVSRVSKPLRGRRR
jgi:hypothetical protein